MGDRITHKTLAYMGIKADDNVYRRLAKAVNELYSATSEITIRGLGRNSEIATISESAAVKSNKELYDAYQRVQESVSEFKSALASFGELANDTNQEYLESIAGSNPLLLEG